MAYSKTITDHLARRGGYAEIIMEVYFPSLKIRLPDLKAFIDTGSNITCINRKTLAETLKKEEVDSLDQEENVSHGVHGAGKFSKIKNVMIRLVPLMEENIFMGPITLTVVEIHNEYDILIGNDILSSCEFTYNGKAQTYTLTYHEPDAPVKPMPT